MASYNIELKLHDAQGASAFSIFPAQRYEELCFEVHVWDSFIKAPCNSLQVPGWRNMQPIKDWTLDTICKCQRLVFKVGVSQHTHKITNLWKFELNQSSKLRDINERKNILVAPWSHESVCFQCLISRPQTLNLRSRNQIRGKLLHFKGSCFINLSPILVIKKGFMIIIILSNYQ